MERSVGEGIPLEHEPRTSFARRLRLVRWRAVFGAGRCFWRASGGSSCGGPIDRRVAASLVPAVHLASALAGDVRLTTTGRFAEGMFTQILITKIARPVAVTIDAILTTGANASLPDTRNASADMSTGSDTLRIQKWIW